MSRRRSGAVMDLRVSSRSTIVFHTELFYTGALSHVHGRGSEGGGGGCLERCRIWCFTYEGE